MQWLFDAMAALLAFFYQIIPSYGMSIILLTLVVMLVVTPLTIKGTRSMMMMQRLQPEIRKLQAKHKDDRQKLNEELMAVYKENQVNPVGGCLPLLVQAPVFLVLYTVLRGLTRRISDMGFANGWVSGWVSGGADAGASPAPPGILRNFDPAYLTPDTNLYQSLSETNEMRWFGIDLAESASKVFGEGDWVAFIPYVLLIAVVAVTGFIQQRQIQGRVPKGQVNSQQQMIMKFLPIMLPIFSFTLPGGLVLYFAVSNLYRVGQQWFISRRIYGLQRGETVESKQVRDNGGKASAVVTTAVVADDVADPDVRKNGTITKGSQKKLGPTPDTSGGSKTRSKGADRTNGRSSTSARTTPSKASSKTKSSGKTRRPSTGASPAPSVQPRGRKKKR
jgi:YidC/Oxa1 family membrane protein insertase